MNVFAAVAGSASESEESKQTQRQQVQGCQTRAKLAEMKFEMGDRNR